MFYLSCTQVCVCYTSDLQTSKIFTVDYYKGVAKSAAEAGAHMIGIKVRERERGRVLCRPVLHNRASLPCSMRLFTFSPPLQITPRCV